MQAAIRVPLDDLGNLFDRLQGADLAVHGTDGDKNRILAQQFPQLGKVCFAVAVHVQQVDLVPLLLQNGERRPHRGVFQLGGDDMLADVPRCLGDALEGQVVGLAGAGGVDDLGGLHAQLVGDGLGHAGHFGPGGLPGAVGGVGVGDIRQLGLAVNIQHGRVDRRVGGII